MANKVMQFELLLMFESVTHAYLSSTFSSVTSLTCLNKHGFINFSLVVLILHAVNARQLPRINKSIRIQLPHMRELQ